MDYAKEHIEKRIGIWLQEPTKDTEDHREYTVVGSITYDQLMELCEDLKLSSIKAVDGNLVIVIHKG